MHESGPSIQMIAFDYSRALLAFTRRTVQLGLSSSLRELCIRVLQEKGRVCLTRRICRGRDLRTRVVLLNEAMATTDIRLITPQQFRHLMQKLLRHHVKDP